MCAARLNCCTSKRILKMGEHSSVNGTSTFCSTLPMVIPESIPNCATFRKDAFLRARSFNQQVTFHRHCKYAELSWLSFLLCGSVATCLRGGGSAVCVMRTLLLSSTNCSLSGALGDTMASHYSLSATYSRTGPNMQAHSYIT